MGKEVVSIDPRLVEGRKILDSSRERMAPLWVKFRDKNTSLDEKISLGPAWKYEIDEHISAATGPISKAKIDLGLFLTQLTTERRQRRKIVKMVVENGGERKDGKELADRLIRLTKIFQARRGVLEDPDLVDNPSSCIAKLAANF